MAIYQGDKLVAENITIDKSLYTLPVGSIIPYGSNTSPTGFLLCDGSEVSKEAYPDLYAVIGDSFGTATDGKFKLPDLRGKFVQGANGDLATVKEAGLPDINGSLGYFPANNAGTWYQGVNVSTGAFAQSKQEVTISPPKPVTQTDSTQTLGAGVVNFNASDSSSIYGASATVQPPAVCLSYIIKALKISDEPNDQYATKDDIAKKVDKVDGMSLIEDTEKARLATVVNYDDTDIKADISKCATKDVATTTKNGLMSATDKKKLNGLATVATTGSYNDLTDKPTTSDYTVFMQETQPTHDGLWIKGTKKDFMFASYIPPSVNLSSASMPTEREFASAVAINGKAYVFGGMDYRDGTGAPIYLSDILEFDPVAKTCTKMSVSLPYGIYGASAVAIENKAYIFVMTNSRRNILEFDPVAKTCTKMSVSLPEKEGLYASAVAINGKAYIFGGSSNKTILEFDPVAKTCTEMLVSLPEKRGYTSAVAINGKAYIFGGKENDNSTSLEVSDILEFDPVAKTCTKMSISLPRYICETSAVAINGKAYIFGGTILKPTTKFKTIYKFNPVAKTCTQMSISLPDKTTASSATAIEDKAYIFIFQNSSNIVEGSFDWDGFDFTGYYIKPCNSPGGQLTKISSHEISSIEKVYNGQTGAVMEAYSVLNGVATKIE